MLWDLVRRDLAFAPGDELVTGDELVAWCKGKVATYKIPQHWKFVDSFPMTISGKVMKFKMREAAVEELGLAKAAGVRTA